VSKGFREASHVTRSLTLSWAHRSLLNLVARRLASNPLICEYYGLTSEQIVSSAELQGEFFYKVFPAQIDRGISKSSTLDWMVSRTADGTKRTAPRELIHLLLSSRDEQLRLFQLGGSEPPDKLLFDTAAIRAALPTVSKARYEQTLCAEYPELKPFLEQLEREKTEQNRDSLARLWKTSAEHAGEVAERLVEAGFFERRGRKDSPNYWVPFLYREALDLVQGSATSRARQPPRDRR